MGKKEGRKVWIGNEWKRRAVDEAAFAAFAACCPLVKVTKLAQSIRFDSPQRKLSLSVCVSCV